MQATFERWNKAESTLLGAAMAYYVLFSLFPLLLIILSIIGFLVGSADSGVRTFLGDLSSNTTEESITGTLDARERILLTLRESVSPDVANQIDNVLQQLNESGGQAGLIGFFTLLLSASGAFGILDRVVNIIWETQEKVQQKTGIVWTVLNVVIKKLVSFVLVLGAAVLLLVSMLVGIIISFAITLLQSLSGGALAQVRDIASAVPGGLFLFDSAMTGSVWVERLLLPLATLAIAVLTLALLFKYLPDLKVVWRDVWLGAILTAVLLAVLSSLSSRIIGGSSFQNYGPIGGVMALLLWMYLTSLVFFFGVAFTRVYAYRYGSYSAALPTAATPTDTAPSAAPFETINLDAAHESNGDDATSAKPQPDSTEERKHN
ncbi:MAG: YihY/virulence factor BrkB family protein [Chloroflexaceae bacterium]|nr:YihY/virulence factor BrkB family protein [Chloroflexaceae bacterium]